MKKLILILCLALIFQSSFVFADLKIPGEFWKLITTESSLAEGDDLQAQIDNWLEIIALFDDWPDDNQTKLEIQTPRYQKIINNYETLKNYDQALVYLELYKYNASKLEEIGLWDKDARVWAESKIVNLKLDVELFVTTDAEERDDLAKFEPEHGLYYGATYDLDPSVNRLSDIGQIETYPKENSAFLIYLEFGHNIQDFDWLISQAKEAGGGLLLAWNAYEVYDDMSQNEAYIIQTANYLKNLDIPVFLRYGAEFNIAEGFENYEGFIENFRYVTDLVRSKTDNVAMVWSPNDISASDRNHEDYYPGDDYVDWVGLSTYTSYYFGVKKDYGSQQEAIDNQYFTGSKANPLNKIKDIVTTYGDRKPIMISENGIGHYSKVANEDLTDWAKIQLQRTYAYVPLMYPQVKAIFYFNTHIESNTRNIYALYENKEMQEAFVDLTASDVYLESMDQVLTEYPYSVNTEERLVTKDVLDFQTLVIVPEELSPQVHYVLNGNLQESSQEIPYKWSLQASKLNEGDNSLTLEVYGEDGSFIKQEDYLIYKDGSHVYVSTLYGDESAWIEFDEEETPLGAVEIPTTEEEKVPYINYILGASFIALAGLMVVKFKRK